MHTPTNKLANKCEKVLISLIVVGMKRSMHQIHIEICNNIFATWIQHNRDSSYESVHIVALGSRFFSI